MSYVYDCTDFKKYLFGNYKKFRVEGLSVWVNSIPIPVDIFNQFFESSEDFFELYLNHVMAAIFVSNSIESGRLDGISLCDFPDKDMVANNLTAIESAFHAELKSSAIQYSQFVEPICEALGLETYSIKSGALIDALSHKGKKYTRIYCPHYIKQRIEGEFPIVLNSFSRSNWDMFGNIIADSMGIYRIGFSDALATVFSRLLDFKINECPGNVSKQPNITLISESDYSSHESKMVLGRTIDGSLWEPFYDGVSKVKINSSHPYYKELVSNGSDQSGFHELVLKLAEYEGQAENDNKLRILEGMRSSISRVLWLEKDAV